MNEAERTFRTFLIIAGIFLSLGTVVNIGFSVYGRLQRERIRANVETNTDRVDSHLDRIETKINKCLPTA